MKILVAGAGHGGLVAAALLAQKGHDVTVMEQGKREDLGHDWEDRFTFSLLSEITGGEIPNAWRYRGDCAFVSPSGNTQIEIRYARDDRQKIMWRKPLIAHLVSFAEQSGVKFRFETTVIAPWIQKEAVCGLQTQTGTERAELVIDAAGVFSPVRRGLPDDFGIEKEPKRGDLFYAKRTYYQKMQQTSMDLPFEIFLCHNREQGLSWCCTNQDSVDILIGRIDPLTSQIYERAVDSLRKRHPYIGKEILHGGNSGIIPVRRPLALMVAPGYAAVGDSAFMTTPMNGMGIDLSLQAGRLLAQTIIRRNQADIAALWEYNREFHRRFGADTAKNEGLKNALLQLHENGVDFLFDSAVIQASDLAGAGQKTSITSLLGKFVRGMKNPACFFTVIGGLLNGARLSKKLKNAPQVYEKAAVLSWQKSINDPR